MGDGLTGRCMCITHKLAASLGPSLIPQLRLSFQLAKSFRWLLVFGHCPTVGKCPFLMGGFFSKLTGHADSSEEVSACTRDSKDEVGNCSTGVAGRFRERPRRTADRACLLREEKQEGLVRIHRLDTAWTSGRPIACAVNERQKLLDDIMAATKRTTTKQCRSTC